MIKGLLLALTLMFITATAALIGTNVQYSEALHIEEGEKISQEATQSEAPTIEEASLHEEKQEEKAPPRFILNQPMDEILNHDNVSSANESGSAVPEESAPPKAPDENKIKKTSEPFLKEIHNIKGNAFGNISSLEKKIAVEFLSLPTDKREESIPKLMEKYLPQVNLIISTADKDVERSLKKLTAALVAINADTEIVEVAKSAYYKEKDEKILYYENILKSFDESICLSGEEENPPKEQKEAPSSGDVNTVTSPDNDSGL